MTAIYEIIDGLRRAKAVQLAGRDKIRARLYDATSGQFIREFEVSIDCLRSPHKQSIRKVSRADMLRWQRVEDGSRLNPLPFPPIEIQDGGRGVKIQDITFDLGQAP